MPSPVPAGYTRGPILFLRTSRDAGVEARLMQRFWNEAGAYGSRIVVLALGDAGHEDAERLAALFKLWESEQVERIDIPTRATARAWGAMGKGRGLALERSTAVILTGEQPMQAAALIGGTALAQVLRRANARSKALAATGAGASVLCQHMGLWADDPGPVQFAPGMGAVNRVMLECTASNADTARRRLAQAVCYNPFLVGVGLSSGSGAVVYPNATLEAFGEGEVLVVDGTSMDDPIDPGRAASLTPEELVAGGINVHSLGAGHTFSFDQRTVAAPADDDLSLQSSAYKAAF